MASGCCTDIPVVSVVGKSNSGKTTLIENCVKLLTERGYHVATIKHLKQCADVPGKDTWRHSKAGAREVVLLGPGQVALFRAVDSPPTIDQMLAMVPDADIVIAEGLCLESRVVVEVSRSERSKEVLCRPSRLFALVTDNCVDGVTLGIPVFGIDDHLSLVDCIEKSFLP